ncbi:response regulator transcription factor [Nonomuraea typhae]|uniref:Response regulator transcription factor n=1 Tax=Nonomuraea typhae TaxID=2603600 RepID=A0ABW7YJQ8_9ACTN
MAIHVAVHSANRLQREALATALTGQPGLSMSGLTQYLSDLERLCRIRPVDVAVIDVAGDFEEVMAKLPGLRGRGLVLTYASMDVRDVVRAVSAGLVLVPYSRGLAALLEAVGRCPFEPRSRSIRPAVLTDRDLEILSLAASGHSVQETARMLGIAPATVENHMRRIFAKTEVHNRVNLVSLAARLGLLWRDGTQPRRVPVAAVFGGPGSCRDAVVEVLIRQRIPVFVVGERWTHEDDTLMVRRPLVAVIIDESGAWHHMQSLGARVVVVTETGFGQVVSSPEPDAVVPIGELGRAVHPEMSRRAAVRSAITDRELQILRSIATGHSVRQTAQALAITTKTVENIQSRLFSKLDVRNRAEALAVGYELGLLS